MTEKPLAIVTGGSNGNLGPLWVNWLHEAGYRTWIIDKPAYDISQKEDVKFALDRCLAIFGAPQLVVNNAAIDNPPGTNASFFGNIEKILAVNIIGVVNMVEIFSPVMLAQGGGNIVNIGSMLGFISSNPELYPENFDKPCAYGMSKAAIWNFTNNCNVRYAIQGLISTMLALSAVEGNQSEDFKEKYKKKIPIRRLLRPEDFENEFLCCCKAKVPYDAPLFVGGGYTIL